MPLPDCSVKYFSSDMPGAPVLSGTEGTLIAVLDACLVNGFGTVTVDSLSVEADVATAIVSTGHGLTMFGNTGSVIRVEGSTPAGLNGEWRVSSVVNSTTFTFAVEGVADGAASGTITVKRSAAGWAKPFSGTNKAVYARTAIDATAMVLRVDDTPAQYPRLIMYESMTDVDTGVGSTPVGYTAKSNTANTVARPWVIFSDHRFVYVGIYSSETTYARSGFVFGDPDGAPTADAFRCCLFAHSSASANYYPIYSSGSELCRWARSYLSTGGSVAATYGSMHPNNNVLGNQGPSGVNPTINGIEVWPVVLFEPTNVTRGRFPGLWNPIVAVATLTDKTIYSNFLGMEGKDLVLNKVGTGSYGAMFDITGPWR